jgi:hypothetical protein
MRIRLSDKRREKPDSLIKDDELLDTFCRECPRARRVVTVILLLLTGFIIYCVARRLYVDDW